MTSNQKKNARAPFRSGAGLHQRSFWICSQNRGTAGTEKVNTGKVLDVVL